MSERVRNTAAITLEKRGAEICGGNPVPLSLVHNKFRMDSNVRHSCVNGPVLFDRL